MTPKTREDRLEHNLRGLIAAHVGLKRKHGEAVDDRFLLQLIEPKEEVEVTTDRGDADEVALGWGERVLRVRGVVMLVVVGLFAALGVLLWINYQGFAALAAQEQARQVVIKVATDARTDQAAKSASEHQQLVRGLEAVIYMLALPEEQRRALRLRTPDLIREMERR